MLKIEGKSLGVSTEHIPTAQGGFTKTTIALMTGEGVNSKVEHIGLAKDFAGELPKDGEHVVFHVVISAFATRNGAGYRLTALSRVQAAAGARVAAVS